VNVLALAHERGARSVAFPSISTGAYGYPIREAAGIAVTAVRTEIARAPGSLALVRFVCFGAADLAVYQDLLGA
jgi:O-acetyl-ADP-ribose deacetylase (regulator of RNase III)